MIPATAPFTWRLGLWVEYFYHSLPSPQVTDTWIRYKTLSGGISVSGSVSQRRTGSPDRRRGRRNLESWMFGASRGPAEHTGASIYRKPRLNYCAWSRGTGEQRASQWNCGRVCWGVAAAGAQKGVLSRRRGTGTRAVISADHAVRSSSPFKRPLSRSRMQNPACFILFILGEASHTARRYINKSVIKVFWFSYT